jgi:LysM domain
MSRSKLALVAALGLAIAAGAFAEEAAAPAAADPGAAPAAAPAVEEAPALEASQPAQDDAAPAADAAAAEAPAAASETPAADALASDAPAPPVADAAPAKHRVELGPVGHDAQGRSGRIHVVQKGDTLWDISDAYLGTPWVWPSLWKDNGEIKNPHLIFPADRIWISPFEMRKVSAAEAEALLAPQEAAAAAAPAAIAETDAMPPTRSLGSYHYPEIDGIGFVTREQYEGAATILESPLTRKWLTDHSEVVIGLGAGEVQVGDQFDIFRTEARVTDLDTGKHFGWATKQLGWLEVTRVDEETSRAIIRMSRHEIQRGDHLLPRRVRPIDIPIAASPGPLEGRIVHTPDRRLQMSQVDVVYLDRGTRDGLVVGSPLEIYRSLGDHGAAVDDVQHQERRIPDHVVAKLLVVDVYDDTSVAVVTTTTEELNRGDHFRGSESLKP